MIKNENKPIHIVHIFWGLGFGGIETMLVNIANAQAEIGAEVNIIIINDLYEKTLLQAVDKRVRIYLLNRKVRSRNPWFVIRLNRILRQIKPDVIHLHRSQFYELIAGSDLRRKACVTLHALPTGRVRRGNFIHRMFPLFDFSLPGNVNYIDKIGKVFTISQTVHDILLKEYGIESSVVNNGIDTVRFKKHLKSMSEGKMRIVQVSRLEHNIKGQDLLIEAASKLKGKVEVYFIGIGSSVEYLKQLTAKLKLEDDIYFLGKQPQNYIAEHLCDYDLFVQASRWEGFGLTVAEAMAAHVPVLASTGQGPAEVICGNRYGWLFENGNVDDLAIQIEHIRTHYAEATKKATAALDYVIRTYDVSVTARNYMKEYEKIQLKINR